MKRWQVMGLIVAASAMVLPVVSSYAQPGAQEEDPLAIYREAGVSQDEEAKIKDLAKNYEDGANVKRKRILNLLGEMRNLSLQADPDPTAVLGKQEEINHLGGEMANDKIKLLLAIRAQLKPEEKAHLVKIMKHHLEEREAAAAKAQQSQQ
jgi:hypothetical protein